MDPLHSPTSQEPDEAVEAAEAPTTELLLTAAEARRLLTVGDPDYGRGFPPPEWERIAARLSALTRLLMRIRERQLREGSQRPAAGSALPPHHPPASSPDR